jgi:uncharacterized protein (DUF849 family)
MADSDAEPLAIAVAPNGARRTKRDHAGLPITPDELAETARRCRDAGAALLHLHVRDAEGAHSLDPRHYSQAIAAVRAAVGDSLVIQATTEAAGRYAPAEQLDAMRALQPEAASLSVCELMATEDDARAASDFLHWAVEAEVAPQFILYDARDLLRFRALKARGLIPGRRHWLLFVLGRYTDGQVAAPRELLRFLCADGGLDEPWMLCAFGPREAACAAAAIGLGGHVRVGFENNLQLPDGAQAPDNAALVAPVAAAARAAGRPLADAATLRTWMADWVRG